MGSEGSRDDQANTSCVYRYDGGRRRGFAPRPLCAGAARAAERLPALTRDGRGQALWGLAGSASLRDKALTVTVVNPHATDPRECAIAVRGAAVRDGRASVLSSTDLRAHNSFEQPSALAPVDTPVRVNAGSLTHRFPPASVTRLQLTLA